MTLTFHIIGTPAPQGSKRGYVVNGRAVITEDSKKTRPWREAVAEAAHTAAHTHDPDAWLRTGPLAITTTFYMPRPRYHYGTGRNADTLKPSAPTWVDKKPDIDKLLRSTLDALTQSGLIRDDAQIADIHARMRYADTATGARITITPLTHTDDEEAL